MFEIQYDSEQDYIVISGESAASLLKGRSGTVFSLIFNFKSIRNDLIIAPAENRAGAKIADVIKILEKNNVANSLTPLAKQELKHYIEYVTDYRYSARIGDEIHKHPSLDISLPCSFKRLLKPFQISSVKHLTELTNAANFSVPGSGKTTMVLAAYSILKERGDVTKIIVVCPRSAFDPWTEEYQDCFGIPPSTLRISGTPQDRRKNLINVDSFELFLCTYQMLTNEVKSITTILKNFPCLLVIDESHHIKKGEGGVWYDSVNEIAPLAQRRIILTGTPAPNQLEDLISQFEILWPGLNPAKKAIDLYTSSLNLEDFRTSLSPFYTRVRKDELGLPKRQIFKIPVQMGEVQQRIYDVLCYRILPQTLLKIEERNIVRDLRKALVVRLLQAASNPTLLDEYSNEFRIPPLSAEGIDLEQLIQQYSKYEVPKKLTIAVNLSQQLAQKGRKSIIWTSFVHNAETIFKLITEKGNCNAVLVTGNTIKDEEIENNRDFLLHQFKTDESIKILVATIPSIAESVSLHKECHDAIYVDRTFNCGLFMQSMDRIHRVGLPPNTDVRYHLLLGAGTIDNVIDTRLTYKMDVMHKVLNDDIGILNLDVPDDLSEGDWDDEDIKAIIEHLRQQNAQLK